MPAADTRPATLPVVAVALTLVAAAVTAWAPMPALLLAPLLFGVPHVLGDLWVLLLRPGAPRRVAAWIAGPILALLALRSAAALGVTYPPWVEVIVGTAGVLLGAASTRSPARIALALAVCSPAWLFLGQTPLVLGHLHNAVALVLVLAWGPRGVGLGLALITAIVFALTFAGVFDGALGPFGGLTPAGLAASLAPGVAQPWADRWVTSFAFAQLLHYLCWVWLLPAAHKDSRGRSRGFFEALRADLGLPLLAAGALGAVLLPLLGFWDPVQARAGYLSLVLFHGWLELAVLAAWPVPRRTPSLNLGSPPLVGAA